LLLTGVPAQAGQVVISDVIQVLSNYQNPPELRLRSISQTPTELAKGAKVSQQTGAATQSSNSGSAEAPSTSMGAPEIPFNSLLTGVTVMSDGQQAGVEVIDQGDLEGTVCDCGEILVPGGFPKWPLLFLAAIPLFFIHDCDDCETPTPTPTPTPFPSPTPTPPPIPEPTSLLLFGTGLAALAGGWRRRHAKARLEAQIQATKEG
jgi:hypothetical protein